MRFTVFTPTYNRAHTLPSLYESLCCQTYKDFEWVIVDDGSIDDTSQIVKEWQSAKEPFAIRYYKQNNGGKCSAINAGLEKAKGDLFFIVDSDDRLVSDALEIVDKWFDSIRDEVTIKGIVTNKGYTASETLNYRLMEKFRDITMLELYDIPEGENLTGNGERDCVFYTSFFRQYPFPSFENEKFMTEAVVYNRMAHDGYKVRLVNDITTICEYHDDGLTNAGNKLFLQNPHGYGLWLKEKALFTGSSKLDMLKLYYTFTCELSPYYNAKIIAECIGTSALTIRLCQAMHTARNILRKN